MGRRSSTTISTFLYKSRCPLGQFHADRVEQLLEEKLTAVVNRQGFLEELIQSINLKTEGHLEPLPEEKRGVDRKLRQILGPIETYVDLLGHK